MISRRYSFQKGVTLIELMIAVALGISMTFVTLTIYVDHKRTFKKIDASSRIQENGRFALEYLVSNIREAGYNCVTNCLSGVNSTNDSITFTVDSVTKSFSITSGENGNALFFDDDTSVAPAAEEYVEGIENMQILYGEDVGLIDKIPDYYVPAGDVADMGDVVAVRISLLVKSIESGVTTTTQEYYFDHDGDGDATLQTSNDGYLRLGFNTTIQLRNRILN